MYDPFVADMEKAVVRIFTAIERRERIAVYGDFDVDGFTSTATWFRLSEIMAGHLMDISRSRWMVWRE
jgi:single-stranded-DNA-specific exonuclease